MVQKNTWYRQTEKNKEIWAGIKDQDNPYVVLNIPTNTNLDDLADSYKVKEKIDNLIPAMPDELQKLIRKIHLKRRTAYVSIMATKWDTMKMKDEKDWKRIKDQTDPYKVLDILRKTEIDIIVQKYEEKKIDDYLPDDMKKLQNDIQSKYRDAYEKLWLIN